MLAVIGIVVVAVVALTTRRAMPPSTGTDAQRADLLAAKDLAAAMTNALTRDDAYARIVHQAVGKGDYEFACTVAQEMTTMQKDAALADVVTASLNAHDVAWARYAAEHMLNFTDRDRALRQIIDAGK